MRYALGAALLTAAGLAAGAAAWPQDDRPQDPPPPKADAPKPDTRPAGPPTVASVQPRRIKTVQLAQEASGMVWSSDGRYLAISVQNSCGVIDTKTYAIADVMTAGQGYRAIGFVPGTSTLVTRKWDRGRINGSNLLAFWRITNEAPRELGRGGGGKPDQFWFKSERQIELDDEQAEWVHVLPDGKTFLILHADRVAPEDSPPPAGSPPSRRVPNPELRNVKIRIHDLATGGQLREYPLGVLWLKGIGVTPDGSKVVLLSASDRTYRAQCRAVADGHLVWDREVAGNRQLTSSGGFRLKGLNLDDKRIALVLGEHIVPEGNGAASSHPGAELLVVETASGKPVEPALPAISGSVISTGGFSSDGRLFAVTSRNGADLVQVWDMATGKKVKQWSGKAVTLFAPDRPTLAVLETYSEADDTGKMFTRSNVGFWDFAPPAK
jgi:hypothetical protein